jgi:hypothetical protein
VELLAQLIQAVEVVVALVVMAPAALVAQA